MTIQDFLPKFIKRIIADKPRKKVTSEYWNELFNLLIAQGDHAQEALQIIMQQLGTNVLFKNNAEPWEPTGDYQSVTKKYVDDNTVHSNNDVTVNGVKTFAVSPIVPNPTDAGQIANKQYVDGIVISVGLGDANLLAGHPAVYYATATDIEGLHDDVADINNALDNLSSAAVDIKIADAGNKFTATNVEGALAELFQYANDGKGLVANAITTKGIAASLSDTFSTLANKIKQIVTVAEISDATALAGNILSGKIAYNNAGKVVGTIPSKTAAVYTPSTVNQVISSGQYLSGNQTIAGDPNLLVGNIKKDVSIFGTMGTYSPTFKTKTEKKDVGMTNNNKNGLQGTRTYTFSGPIKNVVSDQTSGSEYCLIHEVDGDKVTVGFYNTFFNDGTYNSATLTATIYYIE